MVVGLSGEWESSTYDLQAAPVHNLAMQVTTSCVISKPSSNDTGVNLYLRQHLVTHTLHSRVHRLELCDRRKITTCHVLIKS